MRTAAHGAKDDGMRSNIPRLKWIFLGLFTVGCIGVWLYHLLWVWPEDRCDAAGRWWDPDTRICAQPIYVPNITGRQPGEGRDEASLRAAAEQGADERRSRGAY